MMTAIWAGHAAAATLLSPSVLPASTVVLRLHQPWPAGLGRLSPNAARAARQSANASTVDFTASEDEWRLLMEDGSIALRLTLLHRDASLFYEQRARLEINATHQAARRLGTEKPLLGSMGGYYTVDEVRSEFSRLAAAYPHWVHPAVKVGTTHSGRSIDLICVGDDLDGCAGVSSRPTVLYTALVHAREPATVMSLVHFLRTLLAEATVGDPDALYLLTHRKLLFLPVANPDGYAWNERTRPHGGGMKRKNGLACCRYRPNSADDGVDINRNFGYKYAFDNIGSEADGCSEMYRGKGAFSEPETRAIRDVVMHHAPAATLHWHGWGNDIAIPFSYDWHAAIAAADLQTFQQIGAGMSARNHYAVGRAWESVGYTSNGEADDWGYAEGRSVSVTVEVGNSRDSFWPSPSRILPIANENVWPARYLAWATGPQLLLSSLRVTPGHAVVTDDGVRADSRPSNGGLGGRSTATAGAATGPVGASASTSAAAMTTELTLSVQAAGLGSVVGGHLLCACSSVESTTFRANVDWRAPATNAATAIASSRHGRSDPILNTLSNPKLAPPPLISTAPHA